MKLKYKIVGIMLCVSGTTLNAQRTIVESLQQKQAGEGTVTIHQDAQITGLIGVRYVRTSTQTDQARTLKARGFRVQVYAGNNSRQARDEANAMAGRVREEFPEMPVYTYFQSPRWLCRVGDFKSMEEAYEAMRKLKASGKFREVTIVREQINIPID